ncbi:hypothetical protein ACYULU_05100 [Breznakiellaceae bacterium SP9]
MVQFYFLTVLLNVLSGFTLLNEDGTGDKIFESKVLKSIINETFKLVLGVVTGVSGLLKLLSSMEGDVAFFGDFIPALLSLLMSFILCYEYYVTNRIAGSTDSASAIGTKVTIATLLLANRKIIGLLGIISGVLHYLFPQVVLI